MFHKLNAIIEEEKTYKKIAEYIIENDIRVADFLYEIFSRINESHNDKVLEETCVLLEMWDGGWQQQQAAARGAPPAAAPAAPPAAPAAPPAAPAAPPAAAPAAEQQPSLWSKIRKGFGGFWNKITGKPNNPEDVVKILKKAQDFLNTNELKDAYKDELSTLASLMTSVQQKYQAAQQAAQQQNQQKQNSTNPESPGSKT